MSRRTHGKMTHKSTQAEQKDREESLRQLAASLRKERREAESDESTDTNSTTTDDAE